MVSMRKVVYLIFVFMLVNYQQVYAVHILGGEISWVSQNDSVSIYKLLVFVDCADTLLSSNEPRVEIDVSSFRGDEQLKVRTVMLDSIYQINPPINTCANLPDWICTKVGMYTWKDTVSNYTAAEPLYTAVRECCRDEQLQNITNLEKFITIPIYDYSGTGVSNNSPRFKNEPSLFLCVNTLLSLDVSCADSDGDQLLYSFYELWSDDEAGVCSPYGNVICPPPHQTVDYISPQFTALHPVGEGNLALDVNTGLLTGEVAIQGKYAVGIRVDEYRDGVLMGSVFRDVSRWTKLSY